MFQGFPKETESHVRQAFLLSPLKPLSAVWWWTRAPAALLDDDVHEALESSRRSIMVNPDYPNACVTGAYAALRTGDPLAARKWLNRLSGHRDFASVDALRARFAQIRDAGLLRRMERVYRDLESLGLPALTTSAILTVTAGSAVPDVPIRIIALGRFEILRDGEPIRWGPKPPRRILELLARVIAAGGRTSQATLIHGVWKEHDDRLAQRAFSSCVYRLHRALGHRILQTDGGMVRLDVALVWVDALVFQQRATLSESVTVDALQQTLDLYRGPLLPDDDSTELMSVRERFRANHCRLRGSLAACLRASGDWATALACYQAGIAIDPLAESLYQGALACCEQGGLCAEAAAVYRQCCFVFREQLGLSPSAATEHAYRKIAAAQAAP